MRSSRSVPFRALSVLGVALLAVALVAGISPGATKFLTKQKAKKLFYTKAKADARFVNVGEVEALTVEGWHEVTWAPGEPGAFNVSWTNLGPPHNTVAFYKDPLGMVHLKGVAKCTSLNCLPSPSLTGPIFTLPPGYHPAAQEAFPALTGAGLARVDVTSTGVVTLRSPAVPQHDWVTLDGITFRAA